MFINIDKSFSRQQQSENIKKLSLYRERPALMKGDKLAGHFYEFYKQFKTKFPFYSFHFFPWACIRGLVFLILWSFTVLRYLVLMYCKMTSKSTASTSTVERSVKWKPWPHLLHLSYIVTWSLVYTVSIRKMKEQRKAEVYLLPAPPKRFT